MKIRLPWGETEILLDLPEDWRVIAEAEPRSVPPCARIEEEFRRTMVEPTVAVPLGTRDLRGKRIVLVIDDLTRSPPAHIFFPLLLRELERAGADRRNMLMITALGVHRPMTELEIERKVGREALRDLRWENHDARRAEYLVYLGETQAGTPVHVNRHLAEADLIVSVGSIEPHVLAGYAGGLKNLVPGCAGATTIGQNHLRGADRKST